VSKPADKGATAMSARSPSELSQAAAACEAPVSVNSDRGSGKDIAEAFFRDHPTNPLLRPKEPL
jgi:hypothetical protein